MTAQLQSWARALGGEVSGRGVNCPGPGHSAKDRSLSVTLSATAPDGFMVYSHAGDDWQVCRDYVRGKLGLSPSRLGQTPKVALQREPSPADEARQALDNREFALRSWHQAVDPRGTLGEAYLKSRGLELPSKAANEAIRFHPSCSFGPERLRAMICLVRNIVTNEPQAVHRTALAADGTAIKRNGKTFRLSLGPIKGGAIKIDPDEAITQGICLGEGLETCLSGRLIGYRPVWSVLTTSGVAGFPLLPGIDGLTIFGERDAKGASERAIRACAERWLAAGKDVLTAWPMGGNDLNDELRRRHVH